MERGLRHDRPQQADPADAGLRSRHRRLCRPRHPGAGRRAISAREPDRRREERSQLAAVPADARRRGQQGRHAGSAGSWPSRSCTTTTRCWKTSFRSSTAAGPHAMPAVRLRDLCGDMHRFFRDGRCQRAASQTVPARASAGDGDVAAPGRAIPGAQRRRLSADRRRSPAASRRRRSWSIRPASPPSCPASG